MWKVSYLWLKTGQSAWKTTWKNSHSCLKIESLKLYILRYGRTHLRSQQGRNIWHLIGKNHISCSEAIFWGKIMPRIATRANDFIWKRIGTSQIRKWSAVRAKKVRSVVNPNGTPKNRIFSFLVKIKGITSVPWPIVSNKGQTPPNSDFAMSARSECFIWHWQVCKNGTI